jgi:hypothetical protein
MFKKVFFHGLLAGILATVAAIIYYRIYYFATEADFSRILNYGSMAGLNIGVCMIATFVYFGLAKWLKKTGETIFGFLFSIVSFACVTFPISVSLPLDIKNPELFPGLAVPMVFFPVMAWFTVKPLFEIKY